MEYLPSISNLSYKTRSLSADNKLSFIYTSKSRSISISNQDDTSDSNISDITTDSDKYITPDNFDNTLNMINIKIPESPSFIEMSNEEKLKSMAVWSGFFKKTLRERQDQINLVYPHLDLSVLYDGGLDCNVADVMVENCIGVSSLPVGVAPNFIINNKLYVVPMSVEEPSVIAAASGAAKLIAGCGGFTAISTGNVMTAQLQMCDWSSFEDMKNAVKLIENNKERLINIGNTFCESMKKRGGGIVDIYARIVEPRRKRTLQSFGFVVIHIDVNVCEAMGANVVNSIAEGIAPTLEQLTNSRVGLKILTNLCTKRITKCSFRIPFDELKWKGVEGRTVAERIVEAYLFADDDEFRAATHNKGVCNGMDAVALALGQDWRAIEAATHSYVVSKLGYYGPITTYHIEDMHEGNGYLVGTIEIPMAVGTKGGALQTHPVYKFTHALLGNPDAQSVAQIICSVGLAQNFAALRALAVQGIQKGHMGLHARNIAVAAGVPNSLVADVAAFMVNKNKINIESAKEYLDAHSIFQNTNSLIPVLSRPITPSTFSVDFSDSVSINIAFATIGYSHTHLVVDKTSSPLPIQDQLLGVHKGYAWLSHVYQQLNRIKLCPHFYSKVLRASSEQQDKLKLISILLNLIANNLLCLYPVQTTKFLQMAINVHTVRLDLTDLVPAEDIVLSTGFPLFLELWRVFYFSVEQFVSKVNPPLARAIIAQQTYIINCMISRASKSLSILSDTTLTTAAGILKFMEVHGSRWQVTMFLLCDCISLSLNALPDSRLQFIHKIGDFFEWEGTISHDVSRIRQGQPDTSATNVYQLWLDLENRFHSDENELDFLELVNCYSKSFFNSILLYNDSDFFDVDNFLRTSALLREEYNIQPLKH